MARTASKSPLAFKEQLLQVMDHKHHWAWALFSSNRATLPQLRTHFQQEYAVYVRDFPVFLARLSAQNPPEEIRRELAANLYEEETGGLSVGRSHPRLFCEMMDGLGFPTRLFERIRLLPSSRAYRHWLDTVTTTRHWIEGLTVMTIFVEGSINDRRELSHAGASGIKSPEQIESTVRYHPLVRFHGVSPSAMDLIRAHQRVEHGHREAAWRMVLGTARSFSQQRAALTAMRRSLALWLRYRDGVARACRMARSAVN